MKIKKSLSILVATAIMTSCAAVASGIRVSDQDLRKGTFNIEQTTLTKSGFVVVYADNQGVAGEIVGTSSFLQAGTYRNLGIELDESKLTGNKIHIMLHEDLDTNEIFNPQKDTPLMVKNRIVSAWALLNPNFMPTLSAFAQNLTDGRMTVSTVVLDQPGFVIVMADRDGSPGEVIGMSSILKPGSHFNVQIPVDQNKISGKVHIMLHYDTDRSNTFSTKFDKPITPMGDMVVSALIPTSLPILPYLSVNPQYLDEGLLNIDNAELDKGGFITIHADQNGTPGEVIAVSPYLKPGKYFNLKLPINQAQAKAKIHAMIHYDTDLNQVFSLGQDQMVMLGGEGRAEEVVILINKPLPSLTISPRSLSGEILNVDTVTLDKGGFVVVHADASGQLGNILGSSAFLDVGTHSNVKIRVNRNLLQGQVLHVTMHYDTDNTRTFAAAKDAPVSTNGQLLVRTMNIL